MAKERQSLQPGQPSPPGGETGDAVHDFAIAAHHAGARLDKWLSQQIEDLTRTRLKALIEGGALARDGEIFTDPSWILREGETYRLVAPPLAAPAMRGEAIPLDVVFEDSHLIVVNKPAGLVVHPAAGHWTGTLVNALIAHCGESLSGVGGAARPGIVHRLDKDTSGLMVVAKNDAAHQGLAQLFSVHDIERVYEALVVGAPRPGAGVIDAALARAPAQRKKMSVVDEARADARRAVTRYRILESFGRTRAKLEGDALAAHMECRLETGRTHQIRTHFAFVGHGLIGDPVYGRGPNLPGLKPQDAPAVAAIAAIKKFRRQALHAKILGFVHPATGEALRFECAAPADFQGLLAALRRL